ncbi:PilN domain-containing protein [Myxococcaceae bacterium GXIMD 01537]
MMIRINLLPVRAVKKREMGRQILALFALVLIGAGAANYYWYAGRAEERDRNQIGITQTKAKIADLEKVIGEVTNINQRKADVEKKLAVLGDLRKGRSGPVRMLDALSNATPKKLWLRTFEEENGKVRLVGSAVSHDEVAEYMRGLGSMVWTPKGMGRLVEQRRDANTSRVELLTPDAAIEEFPVVEIKPFFTNVELTTASLQSSTSQGPGQGMEQPLVDFNITLTANYAI